MSLKFETDNILGTLFGIATGDKDNVIYKHTRGKIKHFPDLKQPGTITIHFAFNSRPHDDKGRFHKDS